MIFARIEADGFIACGMFSSQEEAGEALIDAAECSGKMEPSVFLYSHKPAGEMTTQEDLDIYPATVDRVVILKKGRK